MPFNTEQHREYQEKRRLERLAMARERLDSKCARCDETEDLEFDHIDPKTKLRKISEATNWSMERFLTEVDKCQLLCRLHHIRKGQAAGEIGDRQLTVEKVEEIRASSLTVGEMVRYYQVSRSTIWAIRSRKTWKHIP